MPFSSSGRRNPAIVTRRAFLTYLTAASIPLAARRQTDWQTLLPNYTAAALGNIVSARGGRALLSSRLYPGTYVRDALFWGPLALNDPTLGADCYRWFAESQLESGQIRTAVPLNSADASTLQPQDDEGTLLFIIASDWLRRSGRLDVLDAERIERAYGWVAAHVIDHCYLSSPGAFRYWADTVAPDRAETISHNLGLLCLARRAMVGMGLGGVTEADVQTSHNALRALYDPYAGYLPLGQFSNFARAQDVSATFPEWLSRYLYDEPILTNDMIASHAARLVISASVFDDQGRLAGIKNVSDDKGGFLPPHWFFAANLNAPGEYQNGGYWPMYTHVMLALGYKLTAHPRYPRIAEALVRLEMQADGRTKEMMRLSPGSVGTFEPMRRDYTWNALIPVVLRWAGIAA